LWKSCAANGCRMLGLGLALALALGLALGLGQPLNPVW
jgi:hypothetical protein